MQGDGRVVKTERAMETSHAKTHLDSVLVQALLQDRAPAFSNRALGV